MGLIQMGTCWSCITRPPRHNSLAVIVCGAGHRWPLAAGLAALLAVAPVAAQTLDDELAGLLSAYPLLDASRADIAAADDAIDRAFADYLPQVSLFADYGYERTDSPATRATRDSSFLAYPVNAHDRYM